MRLRRKKRKSRRTAPAVVYYTRAVNAKGHRQLCVYAECIYGGARAGPIWGHVQASVRRCLATLSKACDCGRPYHRQYMLEGLPVSE